MFYTELQPRSNVATICDTLLSGHPAKKFLQRYHSVASALVDDQVIILILCTVDALRLCFEKGRHVERICMLRFESLCFTLKDYDGVEIPMVPIPGLVERFPNLTALDVDLKRLDALDFISSVLESPGCNIRTLTLHGNPRSGDFCRFETALCRSKVVNLDIVGRGSDAGIYSSYSECVAAFLRIAQLKRLRLRAKCGSFSVPHSLIHTLSDGVHVEELEISRCAFRSHVRFISPNMRKLSIQESHFNSGVAWCLPNLDSLDLMWCVTGLDMNALSQALQPNGFLQNVRTLGVIGGDLMRDAQLVIKNTSVRKLNIPSYMPQRVMNEVVDAATTGNGNLKEVVVHFDYTKGDVWKSIIKSPSSSLTKLTFSNEHDQRGRELSIELRKRQALLALLQGQQVRRLQNTLRRLPVEMIRMVGQFTF